MICSIFLGAIRLFDCFVQCLFVQVVDYMGIEMCVQVSRFSDVQCIHSENCR